MWWIIGFVAFWALGALVSLLCIYIQDMIGMRERRLWGKDYNYTTYARKRGEWYDKSTANTDSEVGSERGPDDPDRCPDRYLYSGRLPSRPGDGKG